MIRGSVRLRELPRNIMTTPRTQRRFSFSEWLRQGLTAGTVLTIATIAAGFIASEARHNAESQELERRLAKIEQTYIPRAEHDSTNTFWRDVVDEINRRLDRIETSLEQRQR